MGLCVATAAVSCSDALVDNVDMRPVGGESDMISFVVANQNNATRGGSFGNRPCGGAFHYSNNGADSLYLNVEVDDFADDPMTRSSLATSENFFRVGNNFAVYGDMTKSGTENRIALFNNEKVTCQGNDNTADWTYKNVRYWFPDYKFSFVAMYPSSVPATSSATSTSSPATNLKYTGNSLSFTYTTPKNYTEIKDFMTATEIRNVTSNINAPVSFNFHHILSRINIKMKVDANVPGNVVVKKLTISNLPTSATYTITPESSTTGSTSNDFNESWSDFGPIPDATQNPYDFVKNEIVIEPGTTYEFFPDKKEGESDGNILLVIPQVIPDNAELIITYNIGGEDKTVPVNLKELADNHDGEWKIGKSYTYNFSLKPEFGLEIDDLPVEPIDAHYVIAKAHVNADKIPAGNKWILTVSADSKAPDGSDVSVTNELNEFQALGFWIDEILPNETSKSGTNARGTQKLIGTGSSDVYVFVPENVGDNNRTITLSLYLADSNGNPSGSALDTKTFEQYHPAWVGDFGWEQTDDNQSAEFGFFWDRKVYYWYVYGFSSVENRRNERFYNYCKSVIENNKAQKYAEPVKYYHDTKTIVFVAVNYDRWGIYIDYSHLNNLSDLTDFESKNFNYERLNSDGLYVTKSLYTFAGTSITGEFEQVIKSTKKTESGQTNQNAFREAGIDSSDPIGTPPTAPAAASGDYYPKTPAIGECLRKNRYYLVESDVNDDGLGSKTYSPIIKTEDIKWYLPAVDQYKSLPEKVKDDINSGEYWSSTFYISADAKSPLQSYRGNSSLENRRTELKVRGCRNKEK